MTLDIDKKQYPDPGLYGGIRIEVEQGIAHINANFEQVAAHVNEAFEHVGETIEQMGEHYDEEISLVSAAAAQANERIAQAEERFLTKAQAAEVYAKKGVAQNAAPPLGYKSSRTAAWVDALPAMPPISYVQAIDELLVDLEEDGTIDKLGALYILAAPDSDTARVNLISPQDYALSDYGSAPTHIPGRGFNGGGDSLLVSEFPMGSLPASSHSLITGVCERGQKDHSRFGAQIGSFSHWSFYLNSVRKVYRLNQVGGGEFFYTRGADHNNVMVATRYSADESGIVVGGFSEPGSNQHMPETSVVEDSLSLLGTTSNNQGKWCTDTVTCGGVATSALTRKQAAVVHDAIEKLLYTVGAYQ